MSMDRSLRRRNSRSNGCFNGLGPEQGGPEREDDHGHELAGRAGRGAERNDREPDADRHLEGEQSEARVRGAVEPGGREAPARTPLPAARSARTASVAAASRPWRSRTWGIPCANPSRARPDIAETSPREIPLVAAEGP